MRRPSAIVVWAFGSKNLGYFFLWRAEQTTLYSASIFQPRGEAIHLILVHAHIHKCRNAFVCQHHRIYVSASVLREMPHIHAYVHECLKRQRLRRVGRNEWREECG